MFLFLPRIEEGVLCSAKIHRDSQQTAAILKKCEIDTTSQCNGFGNGTKVPCLIISSKQELFNQFLISGNTYKFVQKMLLRFSATNKVKEVGSEQYGC